MRSPLHSRVSHPPKLKSIHLLTSRPTIFATGPLHLFHLYSYSSKTNHDYNADSDTVIHIARSNVYRFGQANTLSEPIFKDLEWTVREGESWAVVGPAGSEKSDLLSMLTGYMRLSPPPSQGLYPFLSARTPSVDPYTSNVISLVSFTSRPSFSSSFSNPVSLSSGGSFFDYTARYGAMRDELRVMLREKLFSPASQFQSQTCNNGERNEDSKEEKHELEEIVERLDLKGLMDLPFVVLSNGQTRRARIAKALLGKPELLLLDEPLTGLDASHRPQLTALLHDLHVSRKPRILMALRPQDPLPEWITHVAHVEGRSVRTQQRSVMGGMPFPVSTTSSELESSGTLTSDDSQGRKARMEGMEEEGKELVVMKDVNVRYHDRHILKGINWTIREGEKWHLQGPNGSGKTTLLSLLLGTHPQSYSLPSSSLSLFSKPRRQHATIHLQKMIGHISPEIFSAFPRKAGEGGMNVRDAVGTGFEGVFCYRPLSSDQHRRVDELIRDLGPSRWSPTVNPNGDREEMVKFANMKFAILSPGQQSLVLLLRALVSRPPLLILDEPFAGMDSRMIGAVKHYLRAELDKEKDERRKTSVVFVSHWEDEVPWDARDVKRIRLVDGGAVIN